MNDSLAFLMLRFAKGLSLRKAWECIHEKGSAIEAARSLDDVAGLEDKAKRALDEAAQKGFKALTPGQEAYPQGLRDLFDPPLCLYVWGELPALKQSLAMVGTRRPSRSGISNARRFSRELARQGIVIVSGLARGIDTVSHEGALHAGGLTIAVLGSGLSQLYPGDNKALASRIAQSGAVVSEFDLDAEARPAFFPQRNRLISALSGGTLVVEAPQKSGALITTDYALEQGKDVFAIPSDISIKESMGSNGLLRDGACCVLEPKDILRHMNWSVERDLFSDMNTIAPRAKSEDLVLRCLKIDEPLALDVISQHSGLNAPLLLQRLSVLESEGRVICKPGSKWALRD